MKGNWMLFFCLAAMTFLAGTAVAQERAKSEKSSKSSDDAQLLAACSDPANGNTWPQKTPRASQANHSTSSEQPERAEGEQRFRENCGRCHQPPHKFPPRVMASAVRHMRVRAMLTDEDMRLILKYMTQ